MKRSFLNTLIMLMALSLAACQVPPPAATPGEAAPAAVNTASVPTLPPTLPPTEPPTLAPTSTLTPSPVPTEAPLPTATPLPSPASFSLHPSEGHNLLPPAQDKALNSTYQDPGAVVYHDGAFHMFYNSSNDYPPSLVNIIYATSPDGYSWTRVSETPVLAEADLPYPAHSFLAAAALVEPDGTWVLYFYTRDTNATTPPSCIGRATARDPRGPWKIHPTPVLEPDPAGWDSTALQRPDVVRFKDTYYLYYTGIGPGNARGMIGLATSTDGIHFTRYDDPATTDDPFAHSDPIFRPADTNLGDAKLKYPRVRVTPDGWLLFYHASEGSLRRPQINLATSPDGIHWTPDPRGPVFAPKTYGEGGFQNLFLTTPVYANDGYYLFMELTYGGRTYINLATHAGRLFAGDQAAGISDPLLEPRRVDAKGVPMLLIPAGQFEMGAEGGANGPHHPVVLSDYYLDQYEVSNRLFAAFLNELGNQEEAGKTWLDVARNSEGRLHAVNGVWKPDPGYEDHPVVEVTWYGANAFCAWRGARLPSEAEWEKAARGTDGRSYPWGEEITCDLVNYSKCGFEDTQPVDSYPAGASPFGVFNLAGNVSEWTADWYRAYPAELVVNPLNLEDGQGRVRVVRGGSWFSTAVYLRSYHRNYEFTPLSSFSNLGFRCAAGVR